MDRKIFRNLLDSNEARNKFYNHINFDIKSEIISINQALGRVSVKELYSPINVPPFDRAAMDGFAVLASDTKGAEENKPVELKIVGKLKAGYSFENVVHKGECVEISTGAPMPSGTNSVVMVEYSETLEEEKVKLSRSVTPNENTMAAGADIQLGDRILPANRILTSRELALVASIGLSNIEVYKKPKIAVYSSGDEIILPGKELILGKLYDINSTAVISMLNENGGDPHFEGVLIDKKEDIKTFFNFENKKIFFLTLILLIFIQVSMGAFVSGLDAGKIYQTWPLMGETFFPNDIEINNLNIFLVPEEFQFHNLPLLIL